MKNPLIYISYPEERIMINSSRFRLCSSKAKIRVIS